MGKESPASVELTDSLENFWSEIERVVAELDLIQQDNFLALSRRVDGLIYWKRDFLYRSGKWRGEVVTRLKWSSIRNQVVVLGHSDKQTTSWTLKYLRTLGATWIAASNFTGNDERAISLPIGLTNDCDDGPLHPILGNHSLIREAHSLRGIHQSRRSSIYVNINVLTAPQYRREVLEIAKQSRNFAVVGSPEYSMSARRNYLIDLSTNRFCACPRGNGFDTHRVYEALYMGAIPVVIESVQARNLYAGLPVIFVDDWRSAFDPGFMGRAAEKLSSLRFDSRRMRSSYWESVLERLCPGAGE